MQKRTHTPESLLLPTRKKSLGQNFLKSAHYLQLVANTGEIKKGEHVLEIGPGDGALTAELLARRAYVVAIEKDHRLISVLTERFSKEISDKTLVLHEGDALLPESQQLVPKSYKLIANIPYYITGAILRTWLSATHQPTRAVFLVQKEVAERIAKSRKESILSLAIKAYGTPKYIKTVPRGAFAPAPNVDSAVLAIENISRKNFASTAHEKRFFELLHTGFGQKRKLLASNLKPLLGEHALEMFAKAGIAEKARAEDVSLPQWLTLSKV